MNDQLEAARAAWERLPRIYRHRYELDLLQEILGPEEPLLALVKADRGLKSGLLAVTDSRLISVTGRKHQETSLAWVRSVSPAGPRRLALDLVSGESVKYGNVSPKEETPALIEAIQQGLREAPAEPDASPPPPAPGPRTGWRELLGRLDAAQQETSVDREAVERALIRHFRLLEVPLPEIRWIDDPVEALEEMKRPSTFPAGATEANRAAAAALKGMDKSVRKATHAAAQALGKTITGSPAFHAAVEAAREAKAAASAGSKAATWASDLQAHSLAGRLTGFQTKEEQTTTLANNALASAFAWQAVEWAAAREAAEVAGGGDPAFDRMIAVWSPFLDAVEQGLWLYHVDQRGVIAVPRTPPEPEIGDEARGILERLADMGEPPSTDQEAIEGAIIRHFEAFGGDPPSIAWLEPAEAVVAMRGGVVFNMPRKLFRAETAATAALERAGPRVKRAAEAALEKAMELLPRASDHAALCRAAAEAVGASRATRMLTAGDGQSEEEKARGIVARVSGLSFAAQAARWAAAWETAERIGKGEPALALMVEIWSPFVDAWGAGLGLYREDKKGLIAALRP